MAGLPSEKSTTSFWHSEPSHFLLDHHTTSEVPAYADIVIVGSGITGTSAARYLAEDGRAEGQSVLMLDAREACWGATGRVRQLIIIPPLVYLSSLEIVLWKSMESNTDSTAYSRMGATANRFTSVGLLSSFYRILRDLLPETRL